MSSQYKFSRVHNPSYISLRIMKFVILAVLLAAVLAQNVADMEKEEQLRNNALDFMKGFIEGIGDIPDIEKLKECAKDMESIFAQIKSAVQGLKHFNIMNLAKSLKKLFSAVRSFVEVIKPCCASYKNVIRVITNLAKVNVAKIAMNIIRNPAQFVQAVAECMAGFSSGNMHDAGKGLGKLLRTILS